MKSKILIVEDELIIALDIKETLEEQGHYCVMGVTSVDEAIDKIETDKFDLILIDINLKKDKDGIQLGEYLLAKDQIPFIFVTSHSDKSTLERVKETRPYGYIVKPFKPIDLVSTVDIVLNNYRHRHLDVIRAQDAIIDDVPFILKKAVKYIEENVGEKIVINDLAKQTRWKSQHFQKLFKEYLGITPHKYIVNKKIEKAKTMLLDPDIQIIQISYELGFRSHSNFCRTFKTLIGHTPESFRKRAIAKSYV